MFLVTVGFFRIIKRYITQKVNCILVEAFGGGHWGLRYCGIGQFFMRYFGNFNLELRYCGILQTCGMRFLCFLVGDNRYKHVSFTFSDHVFSRFWSFSEAS